MAESKSIRPTKKQRELLGFIEAFITEHGYSPSYREIMAGTNHSSVATVALHVNNLITRGHLHKRDRSARSLEVVKVSDAPAKLPSNHVSEAEEKWLVEKVDFYFSSAESGTPEQGQIDQLYVLIGALKVLGLDGAAQSFMPRLSGLKGKGGVKN